jgi:toxin-antitoxin system PIN domain toxin
LILVDANLLLYAYHPRDARHAAAKTWLEDVLSGVEPVRFAWLTLWAFPRISTNPRVFESPLLPSEAAAVVSAWLDRRIAGVLEPEERYWQILRGLLRSDQLRGPLVMGAALAALALEHGATLHTTDGDFARFAGLRWRNPLAGP